MREIEERAVESMPGFRAAVTEWTKMELENLAVEKIEREVGMSMNTHSTRESPSLCRGSLPTPIAFAEYLIRCESDFPIPISEKRCKNRTTRQRDSLANRMHGIAVTVYPLRKTCRMRKTRLESLIVLTITGIERLGGLFKFIFCSHQRGNRQRTVELFLTPLIR